MAEGGQWFELALRALEKKCRLQGDTTVEGIAIAPVSHNTTLSEAIGRDKIKMVEIDIRWVRKTKPVNYNIAGTTKRNAN